MHTVPQKPLINLFSNFMSCVSEFIKALTDSTEITEITLLGDGENSVQ